MSRPTTPTTNPYMWDDVRSYLLQESPIEGIELEDQTGYVMLESWFGTLDAEADPELFTDVIKIRNRIRMRRP